MKFNGSAVLVTGGSSGIGRRLALDLARLGAQVVIASHDPGRLSAAETELREVSPSCFSVLCDISRDEDVARMAEEVLRKFGRLDILVNNAGYAVYRTFMDSEIAEICHLTDVNLLGPMRCTRAFLPVMIQQKSGTIVNMASIAGRVPLTPNSVYCASKHGLVAFSAALRYELSDFNIKVHVICPGRTETPFFDHETFRTRVLRAEMRYTVTVEEISRATLEAVRKGRFLTYVPPSLGLVVWLLNAAPWIAEPLFRRAMIARIRSYYSAGDERRGGVAGA